jgi:dihydroflavonol-4-reductase
LEVSPVKALVTGATGFVGAAVTRKLRAAGYEVRAMTRADSDRRNLADLDVEITVGDLRDAASLVKAVRGTQILFHVAADYRFWVPDPKVMYETNVEGTRRLMLAAMDAGVERIVYTSSVATLGIPPNKQPGREDTPTSIDNMVGPYKRSKFMAEEVVRQMANTEQCPVVIVNPSTPIGPGDIKPTPSGRIILDAINGLIPSFVDTGLIIVHVDDVADGHLLALEKGRIGEHYILGSEDVSLEVLLGQIARLVGRRPPRVRIPHQLAMGVAHASEAWSSLSGREPQVTLDSVRMARKAMYFSSDKAKQELGYRPRSSKHAIADAVAWFRDWDRSHDM